MKTIDKSETRHQLEAVWLMASSFYSVRSYIDLCSNALLYTLNDLYVPDSDPSDYMDLAGGGGDLLRHYIRNQLKDDYHYGSHNIIINTCLPADNWRAEERGGPIEGGKYVIADDSVSVDIELLDGILNEEWLTLVKKGVNSYHFINHNNLDILDLTTIISLELRCQTAVRPYKYLLLMDGNGEYIHYNTIKTSFHTEMEIMLRGMGILS